MASAAPELDRTQWPVGVLGMGVMGTRVAQTLAGMDYPVAGCAQRQCAAGRAGLWRRRCAAGFLARTRVLVNTLPLTDETRDLLRRDTLSQLLPGAHLINMGARRAPGGRGPAGAARQRAYGRRGARRFAKSPCRPATRSGRIRAWRSPASRPSACAAKRWRSWRPRSAPSCAASRSPAWSRAAAVTERPWLQADPGLLQRGVPCPARAATCRAPKPDCS